MSDGEMVIDGYRLLNCIASGSSSQIWEVAPEGGGGAGNLVMKLLLPDALKEPTEKATLKHEYKIGKSLNHPSFVSIFTMSVTKQHGYILMEYFRAPNLKSQIMADYDGMLSRFHKMFENLCLAFAYLHEQGWIHRDIKPDNVLINKAGELKVIDFSLSTRAAGGLSKLFGSKSKVVQGTRTYIAPETILKQPPTIQTDIYSFGVLAFEVLAGRPPFSGASPSDLLRMHITQPPPNPSEHNKNITPEMDRVVQRMLAKKPKDRYQNMNEVYSEFRSVKPFVRDPAEIVEERRQKAEADKKAGLQGLGSHLDSRADDERTRLGIAAPKRPEKRKPTIKLPPAKPGKPEPGKSPPPQQQPGPPQQPYGPPQPMPPGYGPPGPQQYPGPYPPGYPPQYPGGYPPGQYPPAPMMPPGMMPPGQPQGPPQGAPGQPQGPPQGQPPGAPQPFGPPQPQSQPQQQQPQQPPQQRPAQPPSQPAQPAAQSGPPPAQPPSQPQSADERNSETENDIPMMEDIDDLEVI